MIEIVKGKAGWHWRLKARNGRILCHSEAYSRKRDAERAVTTALTAANKAWLERTR